MKHFLLFIGILTVLSQAHGDNLRDALEGKPHDAEDICTSKPNWALIPHPYDCNKFYVCANHIPEEMKCLRNYYFDKKQNRCIFGSCANDKDCREGLVASVEDNCHSFEFCENGNYKRIPCQDGSYFDKSIGICMPIDDTPQHKCSCILPPYSILKNADDCASYYVCMNGRAVLKHCQRGYFFNSYLNACVVDLHSVCFEAPIMTSEENAMVEVCERLGLNDDDTNDGRLNFQPDAEECSKFYMCVNGRAITKYCPEGFYYNRELRFCEEDTFGHACQAIQEKAQKMRQEQEKEAQQHEIHHEADNNQLDETDPKPPVKLALSMTHVKLDVEKHDENVKNAEKTNALETIMPVQNELLNVPVIPAIAPFIEHSKHVDEKENAVDDEEKANNSAEVEESSIVEMKLPLSELKLPTKSQYEKLASKFMSF